jgi:hypothetical protein
MGRLPGGSGLVVSPSRLFVTGSRRLRFKVQRLVERSWSNAPRAWSILGLVAASLAVWSVLFLPTILVDARHLELTPKDRLDAEAGIRSSLLQTIGGGVLLAGLYFTARGFRLTREGHITDRYAKSIEQIGHDNADVRIGGVFALENRS